MQALGLAITLALALGGTPHSRIDVSAEVGTTTAGLRTVHATLRCDGSSTHGTGYLAHRAKRACRFVGSDTFARVLRDLRHTADRVCNQIYGGPQRARLRGRVSGRSVDVSITRTDGCGISDWQALRTLLGDPERPT